MYCFDQYHDRSHTGAGKWDEVIAAGNRFPGTEETVIPLTTADMEFRTAPEIMDQLLHRAAHGIFGYTKPDSRFYDAITHWLKKRHGQNVDQEEIVVSTSVVPLLMAAIRSCTREGDSVITLAPAYTGFYTAINETGRIAVESPLVYENGRWGIDAEDFGQKASDPGVTAFLLCNPHNPCGRVFSLQELQGLAGICIDNQVMVIADEIHSDLILSGRHIMYRSLSEQCREHSITCMAPTKTFNLAGLQIAYSLIANEPLREKFRKQLKQGGHMDAISAFGYTALIAAYEAGESWLEELLMYLRENVRSISKLLKETDDRIVVSQMEGTYLAWLDFRSWGMTQEELLELLWKQGLYMTDGRYFGAYGSGFLRMNLAVPGWELVRAAGRLKRVKPS